MRLGDVLGPSWEDLGGILKSLGGFLGPFGQRFGSCFELS